MSDTPRTDARVEQDKPLDNLQAHNCMLDHARELERELGALLKAGRDLEPFLTAKAPVEYVGNNEAWNARARFLWLLGEPHR